MYNVNGIILEHQNISKFWSVGGVACGAGVVVVRFNALEKEPPQGNAHLLQKVLGHGVNDGPQFTVLARITDVGPGQDGDEQKAGQHVAQLGGEIEAGVARDAGGQVERHDEGEDDGGGPEGVEDVLALVVLDKALIKFCYLVPQLVLILLAELFAPHFFNAPEVIHRTVALLLVLLLQQFGRHEWLFPTTDLEKEEEKEKIICIYSLLYSFILFYLPITSFREF